MPYLTWESFTDDLIYFLKPIPMKTIENIEQEVHVPFYFIQVINQFLIPTEVVYFLLLGVTCSVGYVALKSRKSYLQTIHHIISTTLVKEI